MGSGAEHAVVSVVCDADGIVLFQTASMTRADGDTDQWRSGEAATCVGQPVTKTYWFDHIDCDQREIQQIIRRAAAGTGDRVRVWIRVSDQQLIRAELTATPLVDGNGESKHVLVRTDPTHAGPRRRETPETKTLRPAETTANAHADLLALRLAVPLLRLDIAGGAVLGVNDALADLLERRRDECVQLPFSELIDPRDRRNAVEAIAAAGANGLHDRPLEVHLLTASGNAIFARLTFTNDPAAEHRALIVAVRDLSAEQRMAQLMEHADQVAQLSLRNGRQLERLDKLIDHAPVGLALYEAGQLVRSNALFDRAGNDVARRVDDLAARAAEQSTRCEGEGASAFFIADETPLVGAILTPTPASTPDPSLPSLVDALRSDAGIAAYRVFASGAIDHLVPAKTHRPVSSSALFDDASQSGFDAACDEVRASRKTLSRAFSAPDGQSIRATMAPLGGRELLLLIDDRPGADDRAKALAARIAELEALADQLKHDAADPADLLRLTLEHRHEAQRNRLLLEALQAGQFRWNIEAGEIEADARSLAILEIDATQAPRTPAAMVAAALAPDREQFERALFDAMSAEGNSAFDLTLHVGASHRSVRLLGQVLFAEREGSRDPDTLLAIVVDESADRQQSTKFGEVQAALALRTAELNAVLECSADLIRIRHDHVIRQNSAAAERFGDENAFAADGPPARALEGEPASAEVVTHDVNGQLLVLQSNAAPVRVDGNIVGVVAVERDITEQRQLEKALRDREQEIAAFFQNTGVGVIYLDAGGAMTHVNPQLSVLLGYSHDNLVGQPLAALAADEDRPTLQGQIEAVLHGELTSCTSELRFVRRGGQATWVQLTIAPRVIENGRAIVALLQDANELRLERERSAELASLLTQMTDRYELLNNTFGDGYLLLDGSMHILEANDAAHRLLNLSTDPTQPAFGHLSFTTAEGQAVTGGRLPWSRAQRGKPNTLELNVRPRGTTPESAEAQLLEFDASPVKDNCVAVRVRDLSQRRNLQEELQKTYARVVEAHTLLQQRTQQFEGNLVSAVQQLGAAVASAMPVAKSMSGDSRLPSDVRQTAARLIDAFRVHERLVQHYTDTAVSGTASTNIRAVRSEVDVHALVHEAIKIVTSRFNVGGRLKTSLDATQTRCVIDAAMMTHAFWSVFAHAASQASRSPATIRTQTIESEDGPRVELSISWPGKSITTAEIALARHFTEAEGGGFDVATADGVSTARILIPIAPAATARTIDDAAPLRVLLLEDHDSTARVLARQLTRLKCVVTPVSTLAAGRERLRGESFDLIVCDLTLPDGDAMEFMQEATRAGGNAPRGIALRGYTSGSDDPTPLRAAGFVEQLTKPVDLAALSAAIARLTRAQ